MKKFAWVAWTITALLVCIDQDASANDKNVRELVTKSLGEAHFQRQIHEQTWGMSQATDVGLDQSTGKIAWTFDDGRRVEAPVQIVGTYNPATNYFVWSWANHSILSELHRSALEVKAYGEAHDIARFTAEMSRQTPEEAWQLAAVANHLSKSNGAFEARSGGLVIYVTFGQISLGVAPD